MSSKGKNNSKKIIRSIVTLVLVLAVVFAALYVKSLLENAPEPDAPSNTSNVINVIDPEPEPEPAPEPEPSGPVYYSASDLNKLKNTDVFNKSAIEHIFLGTVNSSGKGSGYHYDMIKDSPGKILEETRSKTDKNGCYTAYVEVDGHEKDHYSTFYPDDWSPQQVVDAIVAARSDALKNNRHKGDTYIGYYNGIEIDMYLDGKDRVVTAYPIYSK